MRSSPPLTRRRSTTATRSPPWPSALASLTHRLDEMAERARERMDPPARALETEETRKEHSALYVGGCSVAWKRRASTGRGQP